MSEPRTPQVPMIDKHGDPFYPLTQYNQIVMPDGGRWDGEVKTPSLEDLGAAADNHSHEWNDIKSKPESYTPAAHNHNISELPDVPDFIQHSHLEEWTLTLEDGSTITKKVLIGA